MDFYFDENFSHAMASALNELESIEGRHRVFHTTLAEGMRIGMPDEELIPLLGKRNGIWMTKDKKATTRRAQHQLLRENDVPAFFFGTPGINHWDQIIAIMQKWKAITKFAQATTNSKAPRYFTVLARGGIQPWEV